METTSGGRIGRRVFREEVKEHLISAILRGDLKPGDHVIETKIAARLGVSQGPVREALRELELLGFVKSPPFRSAQVCDVSLEKLGQRYPLRALVEGMALMLAFELQTQRRRVALVLVQDAVLAGLEASELAGARQIRLAAGGRRLVPHPG